MSLTTDEAKEDLMKKALLLSGILGIALSSYCAVSGLELTRLEDKDIDITAVTNSAMVLAADPDNPDILYFGDGSDPA